MTSSNNQDSAKSYAIQLSLIIVVVAIFSSLVVYNSTPPTKQMNSMYSMQPAGPFFSVSLENEDIMFETYQFETIQEALIK